MEKFKLGESTMEAYEDRDSSRVNLNQIFARFYNFKGTMHTDEGKFKEAIEYFNKAIALDPHYSAAFFNRATVKADIGFFDEAKNDFKKAHFLKTISE
jgi:tetratricopeptide (TPR) repeat protein